VNAPMIDVAALRASRLETSPFTWAHCAKLVPDAVADELAASFPTELLTQSTSARGHYLLRDCTVVDREPLDVVDALAPAWRQLVTAVVSETYRAEVAALLDVKLDHLLLKVRPCEYAAGSFMAPHTDRPSRVVTQVFYLTPYWDPSWGGGLAILRSPDPDDRVETVNATLGSSVLFVRSDRSWHAVDPVRDDVRRLRRSLLVQWHGRDER
jgi:SM-20-related protein